MIAGAMLALLTLADAERAAIAHAPAVVAARAAVRERDALLHAARATGGPHAFASYAQAPQFGTVGTVEQRLFTEGAQMTLGDIAGRRPAIAQAQAELNVARAGETDAERTERLKAVGLYVAAIQTAETRALRETIAKAGRADVRAARLRFSAGDAPHLDVLRADVAFSRAQADLTRARADEANARNALSVEVGMQPASLALPTLASLVAETPPAPSVDAAIAIALAHRPEIAAARDAVASEEAAVHSAQRGVLPGVTAQVGWTHGIDTGAPVSGPSANVTLDVPLNRAASDRVDAERARLAQAQARLDEQMRTVRVDVGAAVRTYDADVQASFAAARARREAALEVQATVTGYRDGASSSLDVEDARRVYAQTAVDDVAARAAQAQAAASLDALMGMEK